MFSLDSLFGVKSAPGQPAAKAPEKGFARFVYLVRTHFAKLVGLNMLFLLFCLPVITIPAALSGMNRVCLLLIRAGHCDVWQDFFVEFKSSFLKSLPFGALCAFLLADAVLCFFLGLSAGGGALSVTLYIAAALLCAAGLLLGSTLFALLALVSLKTGDIVRNAVMLLFLAPRAALLLLITLGGWLAVLLALLPYSVPVIALFGLSLPCLAAAAIVNNPIQAHIVNHNE